MAICVFFSLMLEKSFANVDFNAGKTKVLKDRKALLDKGRKREMIESQKRPKKTKTKKLNKRK